MNRADVFNKLRDFYFAIKSKGYEVFGVFAQGSLNYNLADEESDVDALAIVIPSPMDVAFGRERVSEDYHVGGEIITVKDLRTYLNEIEKGSIKTLETLVTEYCVLNDKYEDGWFGMDRESIAVSVQDKIIYSCVGIMKSEYNKLLKKDNFKSYYHIFRIAEFLERFKSEENLPFSTCLWSANREFIVGAKRGKIDRTTLVSRMVPYLQMMNGVENNRTDKARLSAQDRKRALDCFAVATYNRYFKECLNNG